MSEISPMIEALLILWCCRVLRGSSGFALGGIREGQCTVQILFQEAGERLGAIYARHAQINFIRTEQQPTPGSLVPQIDYSHCIASHNLLAKN